MEANITTSSLAGLVLTISDLFLPTYLLPFRRQLDTPGLYYSLLPGFLLLTLWTYSSTIVDFLTVSVEIPTQDVLYCNVQQWLEERNPATNHVLARIEADNIDFNRDTSKRPGVMVKYCPRRTCFFVYRGWWIQYSRFHVPYGTTIRQYITLRTLWPGWPIDDFLQTLCRSKNNQITTFRPARAEAREILPWRAVNTSLPRSIESVILNEENKNKVLACTEEFLKSREWHTQRGIPYRFGILLEGPPGTGKTSLSCAMAGYFGLNIYCMSLGDPSLTDDDLADLLNCLPKQCFVLIEDIDCANIERRDIIVNPENKGNKRQISLSGLLNAIDGPASAEGRILIMTTNYSHHLDEALIRPGRVDLTIPFTLATKQQLKSMFLQIFSKAEQVPGLENLENLADAAVADLPDYKISPSQFQGFLLGHKSDPQGAVDSVMDWRKKVLEV
ncbi:hypothetical protein MaudCBS49596_003828 [Microsporum audouinii]